LYQLRKRAPGPRPHIFAYQDAHIQPRRALERLFAQSIQLVYNDSQLYWFISAPMRFNRNHSLIASTALLSLSLVIPVHAQPANRMSATTLHQAIDLAQSGHCKEALLPLRRMIPTSTDKTVKYAAEMALIRCAMALDEEQTAVDTLLQLKHDEPNNPEVLYISTHYFSELGIRAAQQLQAQSPVSYQARRLEAEALESQGKNDEAATIYRKILDENPKIPGIHYRLGQIALDSAGPNGSTDEAKREFQNEISVDPSNASAQFVLGELARRSGDWTEAIARFSSAAKLDAGFSEAFLAFGMSLTASGQFSQALSPLETYVKMQPEDPSGHYQLAIAFSRTGNKDGAAREMALQAQAASRAKSPGDSTEGHPVHP
jgi:tetratricopeptide (TPR) repeat protein